MFVFNLPKCFRLGDMVSSSFLCHCRGGGTASSSQSCCSDPALLWRSPASWNRGPPVATGNGHCREATIHQLLQRHNDRSVKGQFSPNVLCNMSSMIRGLKTHLIIGSMFSFLILSYLQRQSKTAEKLTLLP